MAKRARKKQTKTVEVSTSTYHQADLVETEQSDDSHAYLQVDVIPIGCPKCHCTDRKPYFAIKRLESSGMTPDGMKYTRITYKRTRCARCNQARVDRIFERPAE